MPGRGSYGRLLRNRNFVVLWLGQLVSYLGDYLLWLAVPIWVEKLTGSTVLVGLSLVSTALPMLVVGTIAGVFVDRWDLRRTMIAADVIRAVLVFGCVVVDTAGDLWILYLLTALRSCVSRFAFPARSAILPLLVCDPRDLAVANGLMEVVQTAGLLVGPGLGGVLVELWGFDAAVVADAVSFLVSGVAISAVGVPGLRTAAGPAGHRRAVLSDLRSGLAHLRGTPTLVGVLVCVTSIQMAWAGMTVVWAPFLSRVLGVQPAAMGIVHSAQGLGMVVSSLALARLLAGFSRIRLVGVGLFIIGMAVLGMGLASSFATVVALSFVVGLPFVLVQSVLITMMQTACPGRILGRVSSAVNSIATVGSLLSIAVVLAVADVIGLRAVYVFSGLGFAAAGALALVLLREPAPSLVGAAEPQETPLPSLCSGRPAEDLRGKQLPGA